MGLFGPPKIDELERMLYWGYQSELRHAGLEEVDDIWMFQDERVNKFVGIFKDGYTLPSTIQAWGPNHERYMELNTERDDCEYWT